MERKERLERQHTIRMLRRKGLSIREIAAQVGCSTGTVHRALQPGGGKRVRHGEGCTCTRCAGFQPGHEVSLRHGHRRPAAVREKDLEPRARQIVAEQLAHPYCPAYLHDGSWDHALMGWAILEASAEGMRAYISQLEADESLAETTTLTETTTEGPDGITRMSVSRRLTAAREHLRRDELAADKARQQLGLTPLSRARLGKDVSAARAFDLARFWVDQDEQETATGQATT